MSEAAADTTATETPNAPAEQAPPAAPAPTGGSATHANGVPTDAARAAARAILSGAKPSSGKSAPPAQPNGAKPAEQAAADVAAAEAARSEPEKSPAKPPEPQKKSRDNNPVLILREKGKRLDAARAAAETEKTETAKARAELEAQRAALAKERESMHANVAEEVRAARSLIEIARRQPERALSYLAELSGQKTQDIIARVAERMANGTQGDDAARAVSDLERRMEERLAAERDARQKLIDERKAEADAAAKRAEEQQKAERSATVDDTARRFVSTAKGLEKGADPILARQAELLPYVAAVAKANPGRVERAVRRIMSDAYEKLPGWVPDHEELNKIALHLEAGYRSEYEGVSSVLGPRKGEAPAAPLGAPAAQAPASLSQQQRPTGSANGNGNPPRVHIAAAAGSSMRRPATIEERRAEAARILRERAEG